MVQFEKSVQVLNWLARQNGGRIGKLRALKLVFFADRYHLRKYGRMVTEDEYWAMKYGPVPSVTKEVAGLSFIDGDSEDARYAARFLNVEAPNGKPQVVSLAPVDRSALSDTDVEALAFAWDTFGRRHDLVEQTHVYPEWAEHQAAIVGQGAARRRMSPERFLDDPPPGHNPCYPLTPAERKAAQALLRERQRVLAALGQE